MVIPSMDDFMLPCLEALANGASNPRECLPALKQHFGLSDEEMKQTIPSGMRTRAFDRADWAIFHMRHAGLVERPRRGFYQPTKEGLRYIASGQRPLNKKRLEDYPAYLLWRKGNEATGTAADVAPNLVKVEPLETTPEDQMEDAFSALSSALEEDLMQRLHAMDPVRFERLILDLLRAMGYGAGSFGSHEMTKASGDGGIDGIIYEDALGLDAVYIQAKRYQPETRVGRPAIQQFIGSLTGEGATKGVFVTTSAFSAEARDYLRKVQHRVVLIDGSQLARLMVQHGVGVRDRLTYVIRSVDEDYFAEPEG